MPTPKYQKIAHELRLQISEMIEKGIKTLPTERDLAAAYEVSRQTIRQSLLLLEEEHLITRRQGSGIFISGLKPDTDNQIIALVSTDTEYIYPALCDRLKGLFQTSHFRFSVSTHENRYDMERVHLMAIHKRLQKGEMIRGLIAEPVCSTGPSPNVDLFEKIAALGCQLLFLYGYYTNITGYPFVMDDNDAGGYEMGSLLVRRGHRHIAGIFQGDTVQGQDRKVGFLRSLNEANLSPSDDNLCLFTLKQLSNLQKNQDTGFLSEFIRNNLFPCTAVVCHNDEIAYWLIREFRNSGISVPSDVSVVSMDGSYLADMCNPQLTTLSHISDTIPQNCYDIMMELLRGQFGRSASLKFEIKNGGSTATIS